MRRREVIPLLGGLPLAPSKIADAQPRLPRVGLLWHGADEKGEAIYMGDTVSSVLDDLGLGLL